MSFRNKLGDSYTLTIHKEYTILELGANTKTGKADQQKRESVLTYTTIQ